MTVKEKAEKIFIAYDHYMGDIGDRLMEEESRKADVYSEVFQDNFQDRLLEMTEVFFDTKLSDIDNMTPNALFNSLSDLDACMEVFAVASQFTDEQLPQALTDRIFSFGEQAEQRLLQTALNSDWTITAQEDLMDARDSLIVSMNAVRLLGKRQKARSISPVLDHYYRAKQSDDYVSDVISAYAEDLGEAIIPELMTRLNDAQSLGALSPDENMMMILAKVGAKYKSEDLYNCLRRAFKKAERKMFALLSFRDYGDPKAIVIIKGFLDRNGRQAGREFFYEALSVIQALGGDINDITDPFKDFSRKQ